MFLVCLLAGCSTGDTEAVRKDLLLTDLNASRLILEVSSADVMVHQAGDTALLVRTGGDQQPDVLDEGDILRLERSRSGEESAVEVWIPEGMALEVYTESGGILLQGLYGDITAHSISGVVRVQDCTGALKLRAQRGDAVVSGGSGELRAVGDHGVLTVERFEGTVSMSTIMGTLVYESGPQDANEVRLETDHGPVQVNLSSGASMQVVVKTTSGEVACMVSDLIQTYDGCEGELGDGTGSLMIRTVSGRVDIRNAGPVEEDLDE